MRRMSMQSYISNMIQQIYKSNLVLIYKKKKKNYLITISFQNHWFIDWLYFDFTNFYELSNYTFFCYEDENFSHIIIKWFETQKILVILFYYLWIWSWEALNNTIYAIIYAQFTQFTQFTENLFNCALIYKEKNNLIATSFQSTAHI